MSVGDWNPQAFPVPPSTEGPRGDLYVAEEGMTLRDWFAGQALISMGTWTPYMTEGDRMVPVTDPGEAHRVRAEYAYAEADAMLAHRVRYVNASPECRAKAEK